MVKKIDIEARLQRAVNAYWGLRGLDGSEDKVRGGAQLAALESLVVDVLCEAGLERLDVRTRSELELPGYFRATKKWDLVVVADGRLVLAMEFKSQVGKSIGNNVNNRAEEAVGSATDLWKAYREGRAGPPIPPPFLGCLFLLESHAGVKRPVANKEPHFPVDPVFRGKEVPAKGVAPARFEGVRYAERYGWLCRRLVLERVYSAACFLMASRDKRSVITQPAPDLNFASFASALRGHAVAFSGSQTP